MLSNRWRHKLCYVHTRRSQQCFGLRNKKRVGRVLPFEHLLRRDRDMLLEHMYPHLVFYSKKSIALSNANVFALLAKQQRKSPPKVGVRQPLLAQRSIARKPTEPIKTVFHFVFVVPFVFYQSAPLSALISLRSAIASFTEASPRAEVVSL